MCKENLNCLLTEKCTNEEKIRADERAKTIGEIIKILGNDYWNIAKIKQLEEQKMKTNLGFLHRGAEFIFENVRYKSLYATGNGYAVCRNLESGKTEKICLDCEVEEQK